MRDPRVPGELPADPHALPRDVGPCAACGAVELLMPDNLCERCEVLSRAAARPAATVERLGSRYVVAVRYVGSPQPWLDLLGDLVVRHVAGDGGGVLVVARCPEAGRRLRAGPSVAPAGSGGAP